MPIDVIAKTRDNCSYSALEESNGNAITPTLGIGNAEGRRGFVMSGYN